MKKEQKQLLTKPNSALVMVPRLGKLTPISRKVYNALLFETQKQARSSIANDVIPDARDMFSCRLVDMTSAIAFGESNPNVLAKKHFQEMVSTQVDWGSPDTGADTVWHRMNLLAEVAFSLERGDWWVYWSLPATLLKILTNPAEDDLLTAINLKYMARLRSYTAIALYEICVRFKHNPNVKGALTSRHTPEWWVEALTQEAAPIDPTTGLKKRRQWRKLKSASLESAINEICTNTDISVELIEHYTGKAVTEIQFKVSKNKVEEDQTQPTRPSVSVSLAEQASRVGISLDTVASFLQSGHSEAEIKFAIGKFEIRLDDASLGEIENKPAYLRSILADISGRIKPDQPTTQNVQPLPSVIRIMSWTEQRWADVKSEFFALFKSEQDSYTSTALVALKAKGLATAAMIRKIEEGELPTGMLLSKAVEAYAVAVYGPDWLIDPETKNNANRVPA